jgi:NAD(P)-dependent dehydrogenase (short-subunit alcohol dehydrogenase family)
VNNAGREDSGHFLGTSIDQALTTIDLNRKAPLQLAHHFAKRMRERGKGGTLRIHDFDRGLPGRSPTSRTTRPPRLTILSSPRASPQSSTSGISTFSPSLPVSLRPNSHRISNSMGYRLSEKSKTGPARKSNGPARA